MKNRCRIFLPQRSANELCFRVLGPIVTLTITLHTTCQHVTHCTYHATHIFIITYSRMHLLHTYHYAHSMSTVYPYTTLPSDNPFSYPYTPLSTLPSTLALLLHTQPSLALLQHLSKLTLHTRLTHSLYTPPCHCSHCSSYYSSAQSIHMFLG